MRELFSLNFPFLYDWLLNFFRKVVFWKAFKSNDHLLVQKDNAKPSLRALDHLENKNTPICLFAIHWFAPSGAEYYALECARLAKEAGFDVVWIVDYPSDESEWHNEFMEISPYAIYVWEETCPIAALLGKICLSGRCVKAIHIHHSYYAYDHLVELRKFFPQSKVIDSTHIIEINGGGFPARSLDAGVQVDIRNTISQGLSDYFLERGVDLSSIYRTAIAPRSRNTTVKHRGAIFSIGVVGRLSQQKRPYLIPPFLKALDDLLRESSLDEVVNFYIFGYGPYSKHLMSVRDLSHVKIFIENHCYDKERIYGNLDCVLQLSENEGVSLVSYESASFGIPFVATDVGQQAEMVHSDLLLPKRPKLAVHVAAKIVFDMIVDQSKYSYAVQWQYEQLQELREQYDYKKRMSQLYRRLLA